MCYKVDFFNAEALNVSNTSKINRNNLMLKEEREMRLTESGLSFKGVIG